MLTEESQPIDTQEPVKPHFKNGIYYCDLVTGKPPKIIVQNLDLSFDKKTLFTDLDFKVSYGDKVTIVGENGSGKKDYISQALIRRRGLSIFWVD
ncbi:hypothetical protein SEUBUCD646_0D00130 [Saccharomyces eubayanus]|uniref:ABC transporter domain-containing protein n=1 Tax=Saccharomyces eubayanus TaxID=1080349 RepID=A0ABN8VLN6_SACEU|nr:hypothetical protein SEUBUCD650_0D00120 [Saccharomyces eubayanus]CAI1917654.1 hypothetical protein SEUBUCD646_0D00130 [Saccharomyces eubayanus]